MHKGIILLVKACGKKEARGLVDEFLERYKDNVWDWWVIGGRWNNMLAPKNKQDKFDIIVEKLNLKYANENEKKREFLQKEWENLGLEGLNPYCDHYKLGDDGNFYDIIELEDCILSVKEYKLDIEKEKKELWVKMLKAKEDAGANKYHDLTMYFAKLYSDVGYSNFHFDTNVYDITEDEGETIPEDITGYYAVVVDLHN